MACKNQTEIDFCTMLHLDQTLRNEERLEVFKENLYKITEYSKTNGFPEMGSLKATGLDSCRNWAVMITLFHVGQSQPKLFFEEEISDVFTSEINNGRLRSKSLFPPLREGFKNHSFCRRNKAKIYALLESWDQDMSQLPTIQFVDCTVE